MKELNFERMEEIQGGDWVDWMDGACAITGVLSWKNVVMYGTGAGTSICVGYAVGRWLGSL